MYEITLLSIEQNKFGVICGECSIFIKKNSLKKRCGKSNTHEMYQMVED